MSFLFSTVIESDRKILMIEEKYQILVTFMLNPLNYLKITIRIAKYFEVSFKFILLKHQLVSFVPYLPGRAYSEPGG